MPKSSRAICTPELVQLSSKSRQRALAILEQYGLGDPGLESVRSEAGARQCVDDGWYQVASKLQCWRLTATFTPSAVAASAQA